MDDFDLSRRGSMMLGGGLLLGGAATSAEAATSAATAGLNLDDPLERARIRAKIMGSTEAEDVYTFMRIHWYGYRHDGNLIPFYTMNNLNIRRWAPQSDGSFNVKVFECGTLCKFDSEEPLDVWDNPITGERHALHHFRDGPLSLTVHNDGTLSTGAAATVKPEPLNFQIIDDTIYALQLSAFSYPNPFQPEEWPVESSGPTSYWDSQYVFTAKVADILNPDIARAPAYVQLQNLGTWAYWLRMGQEPGRTWGRGFGQKIDSVDDLPAYARADIERRHPEIFDLESWTELVDDRGDYMRENAPG